MYNKVRINRTCLCPCEPAPIPPPTGLQLERVRDRLETARGATPSCEEWASTLHLTKDELLRELAVADEAKEHMISANLRLVVSMARGYRGRGLAFPDLIQEGTMGLVKACEKFNPEMGFQFYTYAKWWIKKSILTGIANQVCVGSTTFVFFLR